MANPDPNAGTVHVAVERREKDAGGAPSNKAAPKPANKAELPSATMSQTKDELLKIAKAESVAVTADNNKAEIIEKIERARK